MVKNFTSCFIGIPIPDQYQIAFEELLIKVSKINPLFKAPSMRTPHITVYYLDKQSQNNIDEIMIKVTNRLKLLKSVRLQIGGFGYFRDDNPRVIFLEVKYPDVLTTFNTVISKNLANYSAEDNILPFHPHVSVSWIGDPEAQKVFTEFKTKLQELLDTIRWDFEIKELVLYDVDSTK